MKRVILLSVTVSFLLYFSAYADVCTSAGGSVGGSCNSTKNMMDMADACNSPTATGCYSYDCAGSCLCSTGTNACDACMMYSSSVGAYYPNGTGRECRGTDTANSSGYSCTMSSAITDCRCIANYYGSGTTTSLSCTACCGGDSTTANGCTSSAGSSSCTCKTAGYNWSSSTNTCTPSCTCSCSNNSVACARGGTCTCSGTTPDYSTCTNTDGGCGNPTYPATCQCTNKVCTGVCPNGSTSDGNGWYTYSGSAQPCT